MTTNEAMKLTGGCTIPWMSLDSSRAKRSGRQPMPDRPIDSTEMMLKCFNCEKDECDNCHAMKRSNKRAIRMKEAREAFLMYYLTGFNKPQICEIMRISPGTYERYIRKFIKGRKN